MSRILIARQFRNWKQHPVGALLCLLLVITVSGASAQSRRDLSVEVTDGKRRVALVIGNAAYGRQPLVNPNHDAEDMKSALQALGFGVTMATDLSFQRMEVQIQHFVDGVKSGDVALFYYSGHGMQIDGENLLVPVDFVLASAEKAKSGCVRFSRVQHMLEESGASLSVMVMDACRTNPFHPTRDWSRGLAPADAGLGSYLAFAASPGQTADDNPNERNGLFTKFLIESLRQPPPLSQLFRGVRDAVHRASSGAQTPFVQDQVIGDFRFAAQNALAAVPPNKGEGRDQVDRLDQATSLYHQGKCSEAAAQFDLVVRANPENAFAQNAAGVAYSCQKLYAQAIQRFNMAIQLKPGSPAAYHNRGSVYMASAQYNLAAEDFTWAIEEEPENSQNYTRRGLANLRLRKYEEALADFDRAITLNPSDAPAFHGRGQVLQRQGKLREALEAYEGAILRKADFPDAIQDRTALAQRMRR